MALAHKQQLRLLETIARLSGAGIHQKGIAQQLHKYGNKKSQQVGFDCLKSIKSGKGMTEGLKPWLANNAYLALKSGESSGDFHQGVKDAHKALSIESSSTLALAKVLFFPILGLIGVLTFSALASHYGFTYIEEQIPKRQWDGLSLLAQWFGQFWWDHGISILITFLLFILIVTLSLGRYKGKGRAQIDDFPLFKQYRYIHSTNLLTSISNQVSIGVSLKQALTTYQADSPPYLQAHIQTMLSNIRLGRTNIGHIFDTGLLVDEEMDSLKLLGEIGEASLTLKRASHMHLERLEHEIKWFKTVGTTTVKVIAALVFMLMAFGLLMLVFNFATNII
ncbi:hypothetical protein [Vibrio maritimus]|uniref:hypothetical protein n=1 Tax=Vibrio maritimus TaxID=990268 RepID=UPI001F218DD0|nr:hypothetical protein [Vibrio maritimus]